MTLPSPHALFDEILDFLASAPSQEEIIAFRPSEDLQMRASTLLDKNRHGNLSTDEQVELDEFQRMNHFMTILKAKARQKLT